MEMGHNSQRAPTLCRRPSTVVAARGTPTLATVTVWATAIRVTAARSALSLSFDIEFFMNEKNNKIFLFFRHNS